MCGMCPVGFRGDITVVVSEPSRLTEYSRRYAWFQLRGCPINITVCVQINYIIYHKYFCFHIRDAGNIYSLFIIHEKQGRQYRCNCIDRNCCQFRFPGRGKPYNLSGGSLRGIAENKIKIDAKPTGRNMEEYLPSCTADTYLDLVHNYFQLETKRHVPE